MLINAFLLVVDVQVLLNKVHLVNSMVNLLKFVVVAQVFVEVVLVVVMAHVGMDAKELVKYAIQPVVVNVKDVAILVRMAAMADVLMIAQVIALLAVHMDVLETAADNVSDALLDVQGIRWQQRNKLY